MSISCPRCLRTLPNPNGVRPPFCTFCGQKLTDGAGGPPETPVRVKQPDRNASILHDGEADFESHIDPFPTSVAGYRLLRRIGAGGMGAVYEAEAADGRRVAVKLLAKQAQADPAVIERFRREGRLAAQIRHPRCVFAFAADTDNGRPYIVMELMPGRTLRDLVEQRGPRPEPEAIARILDVIDGLAEAHRRGVIHRDVKPSNCFLTADGRVKVGDFGLGKSLAAASDSHVLRGEAFVGTVLFAPPEQIRGEPVGFAADVYAVCATLYYLLCGEAPHHHANQNAALAQALSEDAPLLSTKCPGVSRVLERVLAKGLERDPTKRWGSLGELKEALTAIKT